MRSVHQKIEVTDALVSINQGMSEWSDLMSESYNLMSESTHLM